MSKTETNIKELKINYLTKEQYEIEKQAGRISENEIYMTPSVEADIPTKLSELQNDSGYIKSGDLATVATTGSYNDLSDKPTIPNAITEANVAAWGFTKNTGTYSKPSTGIPKTDLASSVQTSLGKADTALQSFTETDPTVPDWAKQANKPTYTASEVGARPSDWMPTANDVGARPSTWTPTKSDVGLGNVGNFKAVSTVASQGLTSTEQSNARANIGAGTSSLALGETSTTAYRGDRGKVAYDHSQSTHAPTDAQKNVQSDWNATSGDAMILNKPTIPSAVTESTVSGWGFTKNTGSYSKPSTGIPKTDLASAVQTSLGKADTALQSFTETDPTVPSWAKQAEKPTYTASEVGAAASNHNHDGVYLKSAPVSSVNSKTGAVSLTASDVGARPDTWTPTASDIGLTYVIKSDANGFYIEEV